MERIDNILSDLELGKPSLFIDSPAEFLVKTIAQQLLLEPHWADIFGDQIDPYMRMDYDYRAFPAMRIYSEIAKKEFESWWYEGDIIIDAILPPLVMTTRNVTQQIQDTISSAMMQQFRRTPFFNSISSLVPGLNEMGKRFDVDKTLGLDMGEEYAPLTQMTVNFKIDLRQWDLYLTETLRTTDDPFDETLGTLTKIANVIRALRDDLTTTEVTVPSTGQDIVPTT